MKAKLHKLQAEISTHVLRW